MDIHANPLLTPLTTFSWSVRDTARGTSVWNPHWPLRLMKIQCYRKIRACPHRHLERSTTPEIEKKIHQLSAIQKRSKSPRLLTNLPPWDDIVCTESHPGIPKYGLLCFRVHRTISIQFQGPLSKIWGSWVENNAKIWCGSFIFQSASSGMLAHQTLPNIDSFNNLSIFLPCPQLPFASETASFCIYLITVICTGCRLQISRKLSTKSHTARPPWQGIAARSGSLTTVARCIVVVEMHKEIE